ncbi:MAG: hypothetical protein ABSC23_13385 [Bryobacteraceae bacterium]|jgi:hypothetical protein
MKCARCGRDLSEAASACPVCGATARAAGVFQTSTVLISEGGSEHRFGSVEEVPARLRATLQQSTHGANAATILIADQRGRQEIAGSSLSLPPSIRRLRPAHPGPGAPPPPPDRSACLRRKLVLTAVLTLALALFALAFTFHWR